MLLPPEAVSHSRLWSSRASAASRGICTSRTHVLTYSRTDALSYSRTPWHSLQRRVHCQSTLARDLYHMICACRRTTDPQHGIALGEQPLGDRVEDLIERRVADALRAGQCDERQREPFAHDRRVTGAKERQ